MPCPAYLSPMSSRQVRRVQGLLPALAVFLALRSSPAAVLLPLTLVLTCLTTNSLLRLEDSPCHCSMAALSWPLEPSLSTYVSRGSSLWHQLSLQA